MELDSKDFPQLSQFTEYSTYFLKINTVLKYPSDKDILICINQQVKNRKIQNFQDKNNEK